MRRCQSIMWECIRRASTYDGALSGCVTPWFIIAREHPEVAPSDKFLIIHAKHRVVRIEKIRVKDNLDAVVRRVEKPHAPNLIQNGIIRVIGHVVCCHSG